MSPEAREYLETELRRYTLAGDERRAKACRLLLRYQREPLKIGDDGARAWLAIIDWQGFWRACCLPVRAMPRRLPRFGAPSMHHAYRAVIDYYARYARYTRRIKA